MGIFKTMFSMVWDGKQIRKMKKNMQIDSQWESLYKSRVIGISVLCMYEKKINYIWHLCIYVNK